MDTPGTVADLSWPANERYLISAQRRVLKGCGRTWVFTFESYTEGEPAVEYCRLYCYSSADGKTWSRQAIVGALYARGCSGLDAVFDGSHFHIAFTQSEGPLYTYYRVKYVYATPHSDGTLTDVTSSTAYERYSSYDWFINQELTKICIDSTGGIWIGFLSYQHYGFNKQYIMWLLSSTTSVIWTTRDGFPKNDLYTSDSSSIVMPVSTGNGNVLIFYYVGIDLYTSAWDGNTLQAKQLLVSSPDAPSITRLDQTRFLLSSLTCSDGSLLICYCTHTYPKYYVYSKRRSADGSWDSAKLIVTFDAKPTTFPSLVRTSDDKIIAAVWYGMPVDKRIYMSRLIDGSWEDARVVYTCDSSWTVAPIAPSIADVAADDGSFEIHFTPVTSPGVYSLKVGTEWLLPRPPPSGASAPGAYFTRRMARMGLF